MHSVRFKNLSVITNVMQPSKIYEQQNLEEFIPVFLSPKLLKKQ